MVGFLKGFSHTLRYFLLAKQLAYSSVSNMCLALLTVTVLPIIATYT